MGRRVNYTHRHLGSAHETASSKLLSTECARLERVLSKQPLNAPSLGVGANISNILGIWSSLSLVGALIPRSSSGPWAEPQVCS